MKTSLIFYCILFFMLTTQISFGQPNVWINEIHYDNVSTDVGEFVEIVLENSGSYTLSDFTLTLYNGSGGSSYNTKALNDFTVGDVVGTYTFYTINISGIQNGSPDGLALSWQGTVIQFLSYEGSFSATNGDASGETSTDIGVSEPVSTPVGESLQLSGTGTQYSDFSWAGPVAETAGSLNNGQTFAGIIVPTISLTASSLSGFAYDYGSGPSASQSFSVSGSDLTNNILITPPTHYEISNDNINFQSTAITLVQTGGTVSATTIYARLKSGLIIGNYIGEDITVSSTGASDKTVTCNGTVAGIQYANIPYSEDFEDCGSHKWTIRSMTSNKDWSCGSGSMTINGDGGDAASDDYLISPTFNLDNYTHEVLSFNSYTKYADVVYPPIELVYSTDYAGNVSLATWTPISATWSAENSEEWASSGEIDISSISGSDVCFAIHYTTTGTGAGTSALWSIDDFSIQQNPTGSTLMPNAWINEIHYDNDGSDVNEMVEVVIDRADTMNLSDFTISLYNGGDGSVYNTKTIGTFSSGDVMGDYSFFYFIYPSNGLQNSTEGIALDWKGLLVQFLSYEGTFIGSGGPANGIASSDIGVYEPSSKPVGQSLQLVGTGSKYSEFSWVDPAATPGAINAGQTFTGIVPPSISITLSTLSGFNYNYGSGPSASQSFSVSGSDLTNNILITPSANYEISTDNTTFLNSAITLTQTGGTVASTTIYVRLKSGLLIGGYNGENITASSTDASDKTVTCDGTVTGLQYATIPYSEDFADCGSHKWTVQSVASNKNWSCQSGNMTIYGYGGDVASDDYLISPTFNLDSYTHEVLSFTSYTQYIDAVYPPVELLYSSNYAGDVNLATWTPISATWSAENSQKNTLSGNIDISSISGTGVCFAFHYTSTGTGAGTSALWSIFDFSIQQNPAGSTQIPNAWINEIHYDNDGTDVNELVEVVIERADTLNLSDFTISLYNGGDGSVYDTKSVGTFLSGNVVGDYSFFYFIYPSNGLQNGPDGIALDWKGTLVQFLSYEGTFLGTNGPATGIVSTDIGIHESSSKPGGQSLQLVGIGLQNTQFSWADQGTTPGGLNEGQFLAPTPAPVPFNWKYCFLSFMLIAAFILYRKLS